MNLSNVVMNTVNVTVAGEANLCGSCLPFETCQLDPLIGQYRCMCKSCSHNLERNIVCGEKYDIFFH